MGDEQLDFMDFGDFDHFFDFDMEIRKDEVVVPAAPASRPTTPHPVVVAPYISDFHGFLCMAPEPSKRAEVVENPRKRAAPGGKRVTQQAVIDGEVAADVLFSSAAKMYKGLQKANKELVDELREFKDLLKETEKDLARERALNKTMQEKLVLYELRGEPPSLVDLC